MYRQTLAEKQNILLILSLLLRNSTSNDQGHEIAWFSTVLESLKTKGSPNSPLTSIILKPHVPVTIP